MDNPNPKIYLPKVCWWMIKKSKNVSNEHLCASTHCAFYEIRSNRSNSDIGKTPTVAKMWLCEKHKQQIVSSGYVCIVVT